MRVVATVGAAILVVLVCVCLGVILYPMVYSGTDSIESKPARWTATALGLLVVTFILLAIAGTLLNL